MDNDAIMVSTAQVAKALGVGVSSVKRWVDEGILPAFKTAGGHRKLSLADVLRLAKEKDFPHLDLRQLPVALPLPSVASAASQSAKLYDFLRAGDEERAEGLIRSTFLGGTPVGELADEIVRPAMARIGQEWAAGRLDVMHEHRATRICSDAILGLKHMFEIRGLRADSPFAVGGSPQSHWHSLAGQLAEVVFIEAGWRVVNLGANTPMASFGRAIEELKPRLLWLSINPLDDEAQFVSEYLPLYRQAQANGIAVAIGGLGLTPSLRSQLPYTTFGDGLTQLAAFARSLHPIAKPRRPGRPPGTKRA